MMMRSAMKSSCPEICSAVIVYEAVDVTPARFSELVCTRAKAWLFAGSNRSGERGAAIYSLVITAKLADVLGRIADQPAGDNLPGKGQHGCANEHPDDPPRRHAAKRADEDDGHRHLHAAAKHHRLEHVVRHAGDKQKHGIDRGKCAGPRYARDEEGKG